MTTLRDALSTLAFIATMAAGFAALMPPGPAQALDRIGWSKTRETMYVHGEIEKGDAVQIANAIMANRRKLRGIMLNSPGGDVMEAARLVDLVRGFDFDTGVTRGGECASACFMLWAAGKNRYVHADSSIGIHATSVLGTSGEMMENATSLIGTMVMARAYVLLNVPLQLIGAMVITPPSTMYWLTDADKAAMNAQVMP